MSLPTTEKHRKDAYQQFFENDGILQSVAGMDKTSLTLESQENSSIKESGKKIILNSFIIVGGLFLHSSTALLFYNFVLKPYPTLPHPFQQLVYIAGGLILLFLAMGKVKKKSDLVAYAIFPLMGIVFSFSFNFWLANLPIAEPFFFSNMFSFALALVGFYCIGKHLELSDDENSII